VFAIKNKKKRDTCIHVQMASEVSLRHLSPLVKWSGGKGDEIQFFEKYFPTSYTRYIEVFLGGGAVFFYLNPQHSVINDIHPELITFYREIGKGNGQQIYNFMEEHKNNSTTYYQVRDEMKTDTDIDIAKRFYYLRKTCFRGMLRYNKKGKFNIPFGRYKSVNYSDVNAQEYQKLLNRTIIENKSFEDIFEEYNSRRNFMFLDPPYDSIFTDYGYCQYGKDEHTKLAELFKETKNKCMMIIGKTDFISELYKDYIVGEYEKKYRFKIHSGRVGNEINNKHLIITNYRTKTTSTA
jgi:DNA adenine methylase